MSETLKPCPFCGKHKGQLVRTDLGKYAVLCYGCESCSSPRDTPKTAEAAWNRRHSRQDED